MGSNWSMNNCNTPCVRRFVFGGFVAWEPPESRITTASSSQSHKVLLSWRVHSIHMTHWCFTHTHLVSGTSSSHKFPLMRTESQEKGQQMQWRKSVQRRPGRGPAPPRGNCVNQLLYGSRHSVIKHLIRSSKRPSRPPSNELWGLEAHLKDSKSTKHLKTILHSLRLIIWDMLGV